MSDNDEEQKHSVIDRLGGKSRLAQLEACVTALSDSSAEVGSKLENIVLLLDELFLRPGSKVLAHSHTSHPPARWVGGQGQPPPEVPHEPSIPASHKKNHEAYFLTLRAIDAYWAVAEGWSYEGGPQLYFMSLERAGFHASYVLATWYLDSGDRVQVDEPLV